MTHSLFAHVKSISFSIIQWHSKISTTIKHRFFSGIKNFLGFHSSCGTDACNKTRILLVVWRRSTAVICDVKQTKILHRIMSLATEKTKSYNREIHFQRIYPEYVDIYGSKVHYFSTIVFLT